MVEPTFQERAREGWERFKGGFRAQEHLRDVPEYASINDALRKLGFGRELAQGQSTLAQLDLYRGVTPQEFDVIADGATVRDMVEEIKVQKARWREAGLDPKEFTPRLPRDFTEAQARAWSAELEPKLAKQPKLTEALARRKQTVDKMWGDYFAVREDVAGRPATEFTRQEWMHHAIIFHELGEYTGQPGRRVKVPGTMGAERRRAGSALDYLTDPIESDSRWMPQIHRNTALLNTVKIVRDEHDIARTLHLYAQMANDAGIGDEWAKLASGKMDEAEAQAFVNKVARLASEGFLPSDFAGQHGETLRALRVLHQQGLQRAAAMRQIGQAGGTPERAQAQATTFGEVGRQRRVAFGEIGRQATQEIRGQMEGGAFGGIGRQNKLAEGARQAGLTIIGQRKRVQGEARQQRRIAAEAEAVRTGAVARAADMPVTPEMIEALTSYAKWLTEPRRLPGTGGLKAAPTAAIAARYKARLGKERVTVQDLLSLPEYSKYRAWRPKTGDAFQFAISPSEALAHHLVDSLEDALPVKLDKVRAALQPGTMLIPDDLAKTLEKFGAPVPDTFEHAVMRNLARVQGLWKWNMLFNPVRAIPYYALNRAGDAWSTWSGNKRAFLPKYAVPANREVRALLKRFEAPSPKMEAWLERGGLFSLFEAGQTGPYGAIAGRYPLERIQGRRPTLPARAWRFGQVLLQYPHHHAEAAARYANFLSFLDDYEKNGQFTNFAASKPEVIRELAETDPYDAAYKLADDLIGPYQSSWEWTKLAARYAVPFARYTQILFQRELQLMRNAFREPEIAAMVGRSVAGWQMPFLRAVGIGRYVGNAATLGFGMWLWNNLIFPEEERKLPDEQRYKPHLIFGRDAEGKTIYRDRIGNMSEALSWFGADNAGRYAQSYLNGRMTLEDVAKDMGRTWINRNVQALGPQWKATFNLSGLQTYPDVFKPRRGDRWEMALDNVNLGWAARLWQGRPLKEGQTTLGPVSLGLRKSDPGQAAFFETRDMGKQWIQKQYPNRAREVIAGPATPRAEALYRAKEAERAGDKDLWAQRIEEYQIEGGEPADLTRSQMNSAPLGFMNELERQEFIAQLLPAERLKLKAAYEHWAALTVPSLDLAKIRSEDFFRWTQKLEGRAEQILEKENPITQRLRTDKAARERYQEQKRRKKRAEILAR